MSAFLRRLRQCLLIFVVILSASVTHGADKKIVFVAGRPSHAPREHEHRAGCLLLQKCLSGVPGITSVVYSNGWPESAQAFDGVAAIVIYADGGGGHPAIKEDRLKLVGDLM